MRRHHSHCPSSHSDATKTLCLCTMIQALEISVVNRATESIRLRFAYADIPDWDKMPPNEIWTRAEDEAVAAAKSILDKT